MRKRDESYERASASRESQAGNTAPRVSGCPKCWGSGLLHVTDQHNYTYGIPCVCSRGVFFASNVDEFRGMKSLSMYAASHRNATVFVPDKGLMSLAPETKARVPQWYEEGLEI
jgi:hypothetical protein